MIRVLLRHYEEGEAQLVGDFAPDQIDGVEALVMATPVWAYQEGDPETPARVRRQIVRADPPSTPRWCLELIWLGREDD